MEVISPMKGQSSHFHLQPPFWFAIGWTNSEWFICLALDDKSIFWISTWLVSLCCWDLWLTCVTTWIIVSILDIWIYVLEQFNCVSLNYQAFRWFNFGMVPNAAYGELNSSCREAKTSKSFAESAFHGMVGCLSLWLMIKVIGTSSWPAMGL